jgi:T5orf172 domain
MSEKKSLYVASHEYTTLTKVGVSNDPIKRLNSVKSSIGHELTLYYESPLLENWKHIESSVLSHFSKHRKSGEWINLSPKEIIEYIKTIETTFNNREHNYLTEYIDKQLEKIDSQFVNPFYTSSMTDYIERELTYIDNGVYRDNKFNFIVSYHLGERITTAEFNVFRTANTFAKSISKRIVLLDLENKKFIKNPKFGTENE